MISEFDRIKSFLFEVQRTAVRNFTHVFEGTVAYKFENEYGYLQACEWLMNNIDLRIYHKPEHITRTDKYMEISYSGIKLRLELSNDK